MRLRSIVIDPNRSWFVPRRRTLLASFLCATLVTGTIATGCADGPLYQIKRTVFPIRRDWAADEKLGITDHSRQLELTDLYESIGGMSAEDQQAWMPTLAGLVTRDKSPQMRQWAVRTAGKVPAPAALDVIRLGAKDKHIKVRMAASEALRGRSEPEAIELLAALARGDVDDNVRLSAIESLGKQSSTLANEVIRESLENEDPIFRLTAIAALRARSGVDYGDDPNAWIAYLEGNPGESKNRFVDMLQQYNPWR
jgi:hypothetical protein